MTRKFKQYIPPFFDYDENELEKFEFETLEELLKSETLKRFADNPKFIRFSLSPPATLMAEYSDKEYSHFVVGFITYPEGLDLSIFKSKDQGVR